MKNAFIIFIFLLLLPSNGLAGYPMGDIGSALAEIGMNLLFLFLVQIVFLIVLFRVHNSKTPLSLRVLIDLFFIVYTSYMLFVFTHLGSESLVCGYGSGLWGPISDGEFPFNFLTFALFIIVLISIVIGINKWIVLEVKFVGRNICIFMCILMSILSIVIFEPKFVGPHIKLFINPHKWSLYINEETSVGSPLACSKRILENITNLKKGEHLKIISKNLKADHPRQRLNALLSLNAYNDDRSIKHYEMALKDEEWRVRKLAVESLRKTRMSSAIEPLIFALKDENVYVRMKAIRALRDMNDYRVVDPLIVSLNDEHEDVRTEAVYILRTRIGRRFPQVEKALMDKADDKSWKVREMLVPALKRMGNDQAVKLLITALQDNDWRVRVRAAEIFGTYGVSKANIALINALKDPNPNVRVKVVDALKLRVKWELKNKHKSTLIEPLIDALNDEYSYVRRKAAKIFSEVIDNRAIEPLIDILGDDRQDNRNAAYSTLKKITGEDFGSDKVKWKKWWEENKESFLQTNNNSI